MKFLPNDNCVIMDYRTCYSCLDGQHHWCEWTCYESCICQCKKDKMMLKEENK